MARIQIPTGGGAAVIPPGSTITAVETANGYCPIGSTTPITSAPTDRAIIFRGLAPVPFNRQGVDTWDKVDMGIVLEWVQTWEDQFDTAAGGGSNVLVSSTTYGGDTSNFTQHPDGYLLGTGFSSGVTRYAIVHKTPVGSTKQALEYRVTAVAPLSTLAMPSMWLNVSANTTGGMAITGYRLHMTEASGTSSWSAWRYDNGTATQIGAAFTEPAANNTRPFTPRMETDGAGTITLLRGTSVLTSWTDPAGTKLTGPYAAIGANSHNTTPSNAANFKIDWAKAYRK